MATCCTPCKNAPVATLPLHCQWTNTISSSANSRTINPFNPAAASAQLFAWFAQIGEPVERYGNKRGKIVKFSQRHYEKMLFAPETNGIGLLSPRIVPPDEADEAVNCDAQAMYLSGSELVLSIRASKLALGAVVRRGAGHTRPV